MALNERPAGWQYLRHKFIGAMPSSLSLRGGRRPTWQSRSTRPDHRKAIGENATAFPRLHPKGTSSRFALRAPRPLRGLAMTRPEAFRILHFSVFRIHFHAPLPYNARQKASCSSPLSILVFPLPYCSSSTHNITNIFVLWKKHKNPRGNPKRSLIIPSRRDLTNAGKCDKIKTQRESGAFKNTDPVFGIARQDRFVADRLGTPAFAAGAPFFFRRGREENQNV